MLKMIKQMKMYDDKIIYFILVQVVLILLSLVPTYFSPLLYEVFIDRCLVGREFSLITSVIIGYLLLWFVESAVLFIKNSVEKHKYVKLKAKISGALFNSGLHSDNEISSLDIKDRVESDIYWQVFSKVVMEKLSSYLMVSGCVVMMLFLNVWFTLIAILSIPLAKLILKVVQKKLLYLSQEYRKKYIVYENWLKECVALREHIKAKNNVPFFEKIFSRHWAKLAKLYMKKQVCFVIQYCLNEFKDTYIIKLNLYFIGFYFILKGYISVGVLLAFMKYYEKCISANTKINELSALNASYKPYVDKANELASIVEESEDKIQKIEPTLDSTLTLSDVSFGFGDKEIIHNFNFQVKPCEHILISGESGTGKTTLLNLISGVYLPKNGAVSIGGHAISELGYSTLSKLRSVVRQDFYLFRISIMDNLRLANENASDKEIIRICQITGCSDFILDTKDGYNTIVSNNFSKGQMQRLAIARAIIQNSKLILFDEPTSALDKENEERFIHLVETELSNRSVLVVSHTIKSGDMKACKLVKLGRIKKID